METICSNCGGRGSDSKCNGSISRIMLLLFVFFLFFFFVVVFFFWGGGGGKYNPGLSPDYQMVCSIHIEFIECLGREIGNKLH